jgi:hypothetical protein
MPEPEGGAEPEGGGGEGPGGDGPAEPGGGGEEETGGKKDPGEEATAKATGHISRLDPAMVKNEVLPILTPRDLASLRQTSKAMRALVDSYVKTLKLVDQGLAPATGEPGEILGGWVAGRYRRLENWPEAIQGQWNRALDETFGDLQDEENGAIAPDSHYELLEGWMEQIQDEPNLTENRVLKDRLTNYVEYLLRERRLTDGGWDVVPANSDPATVLTVWSQGQFIWWSDPRP